MCTVSLLHAQEPEEILSSQKAYLLWKQGYILHLSGEYEKAVKSFSDSISLYPTAEVAEGFELKVLKQTVSLLRKPHGVFPSPFYLFESRRVVVQWQPLERSDLLIRV